MQRRDILLSGAALAGAALGAGGLFGRFLRPARAAERFPVTMTDAEWRAKLSDDQYAVLRQEATERPFTSPLNKVHEAGTFSCAGCANPVYSSATKFDSGTGWPSFWAAIAAGSDSAGIATRTDHVLLFPRTEVHCARCGGHLGHVFDDGPAPTGKRHCINGVAMNFQAGAVAS